MQRNDGRRQTLGWGETIRLCLLFGLVYFIQGVSDPNTGLVAQPDNSLLRRWGNGPKQVATFGAILALPWCLKPLFGMLSDFVPLAGYRRKSYLVLTSLLALGGFAALCFTPLADGQERPLLSWLMVASLGIIFCDVVVDALMIETGQPLRITGRLQSVQWAAIHSGAILTGIVGGFISENRLQRPAFVLCAGLMVGTLLVSIFLVRETPRPPQDSWRQALRKLQKSARSRLVLVVALFVFVWSFNPFTQSVLYMHLTVKLGFSDDFYGKMISLVAVGSLAACIAYGFYCRTVPMRYLVHLSIVAGMASSWVYWLLRDDVSASIISIAAGFCYMTGNMVLVDLAARSCPLDAPGTLFATFMALCNLASAIGTWLGGVVYQQGERLWGSVPAFNVLVFVAGITTAGCWFLAAFLPHEVLGVMGEEDFAASRGGATME